MPSIHSVYLFAGTSMAYSRTYHIPSSFAVRFLFISFALWYASSHCRVRRQLEAEQLELLLRAGLAQALVEWSLSKVTVGIAAA